MKIAVGACLIVLVSLFLSCSKQNSDIERVTHPDLRPVQDWISGKKVDVIVNGWVLLDRRMSVPSEGTLHIRLVDLGATDRPILFREYAHVKLPFHYELTTTDFVGPLGLAELGKEHFYVEAIYNHFDLGGKLVENRWESVSGEGWGDPGRPYPLQFGQTKNILLNGWWNAGLFGADYPDVPIGEKPRWRASGWVYVAFPLRELLRADEKLKVQIGFCNRDGSAQAGPVALGSSELRSVDDFKSWHVDDPALDHITGFLVAWASVRDKKGKPFVLYGTRASKKVSIGFHIDSLKIAMNRAVHPSDFRPCGVY